MLRIFIICVISILGITSKAQNTEKFIEVHVQDEAVIEPDEIEYAIYAFPSETIYFDEDASGRTITVGADSKKKSPQKVYDEIEQIIKKYKFPFRKEQRKPDLDGVKTYLTYIITCKDIQLFYKFREEIIDKEVGTYFINKKSSQMEVLEKKLIEKLLEKAQKKATLIAQASYKKIIEITHIKELALLEEQLGGWTVYPRLDAVDRKNMIFDTEIRIKKTFLVRFQVENIK